MILLRVLITGLLALVFLSPTLAEEKGWTTLFDGTSLDGWKSNDENPGGFNIVDGELKVSGKRSHLFYLGADGKASFKDFEIRLQIKTLPKANSGVYLHTEFQESGWPDKGYECQVNATHKDPKKTGSLYGISNIYVKPDDTEYAAGTTFTDEKTGTNQVRAKAPNTDGEWFDYHIIVQGKTITIKVNGETTVTYTEPADGSLPNAKQPGRKLSEGTFGIQAHDPDSVAYYKNIRVKRL